MSTSKTSEAEAHPEPSAPSTPDTAEQSLPARTDDPLSRLVYDSLDNGQTEAALRHCLAAEKEAIGRFCLTIVGHPEEADLLATESFASAFTGEPRYQPEQTVRAWLFGVARRLCVQHLEKQTRRRKRPGATEPGQTKAERARARLEHLRPTEREVLILCLGFELTDSETAHVCGLDEPAVHKRLSGALERLAHNDEGSRQ